MLKRIITARVRDVIKEPTALDFAPLLTKKVGHDVWLKREDTTPVFSFKLRGAYNRIVQLTPEQRAAGVIAASAGNHAQGVAYACQKLGIICKIVMPTTTPSIKVDAVRRYEAQVVLHGDSYSDAAEHCALLVASTGMTYIAPFDDLDVIAGQGTVGLELLSQMPTDLGSIFIPIGGGGLAAGVGAIFKELRPDVKIIGVEPDDSDAMTRSVAAGERVILSNVGIFADGVAVKQVGQHTFDLCREVVDDFVTVTVDEICAAIKDGFEDTRSVFEGAGALGIAGLKKYNRTHGLPKGAAVAIASGANLSFSRLRYITDRTEIGERREALLAVEIPERPGAFQTFCSVIGPRMVTEFSYRLGSRERAHIFVGVEVSGQTELDEVIAALQTSGYACVDLTDNALAKNHVRRLVGGRAASVHDEVLYDFEFPERHGALAQFLAQLGNRWNISLFHYRYEGTPVGRVLCGFEVPSAQHDEFSQVLDQLGFVYREYTADVAAKLFI